MLSKTLVELRTSKLGLTQEGLAELLGVSFASVNRWESGSSSTPRGAPLIFIRALDAASCVRQDLQKDLLRWKRKGPTYLWSRVFSAAHRHEKESDPN